MEYSVKDLVQFAASGDAVNTADAFNSLISDKIASSIEAKKIELAQRIFNQSSEDSVSDKETSVEDEEAHEDA